MDIFSPFASLKWEECKPLPVALSSIQATLLDDKVYVGSNDRKSLKVDSEAKIYVYSTAGDIWSTLDAPVHSYALATYRSQLVLAGGEEKMGLATKKVWDLKESQSSWQITLPEMKKGHSNASALGIEEHLLVAGGLAGGSERISDVEIFNGDQWTTAPSLPRPCYSMRSVVLDGKWYLGGGVGQENELFYASIASLTKDSTTAKSQDTVDIMWNTLPNVPQSRPSLAAVDSSLIAIGGQEITLPSKEIYAYSFHTKSWVHVDSMSTELCGSGVVTLPDNKLLSVGGVNRNGITKKVSKGYVQGMKK